MGELSANPTLGKTNGSCVAHERRQVEKAFSQELFQDSARAKPGRFHSRCNNDGRRGTLKRVCKDACRAELPMIWPHFCIVRDSIKKDSLPSPGGFFIFPDGQESSTKNRPIARSILYPVGGECQHNGICAKLGHGMPSTVASRPEHCVFHRRFSSFHTGFREARNR